MDLHLVSLGSPKLVSAAVPSAPPAPPVIAVETNWGNEQFPFPAVDSIKSYDLSRLPWFPKVNPLLDIKFSIALRPAPLEYSYQNIGSFDSFTVVSLGFVRFFSYLAHLTTGPSGNLLVNAPGTSPCIVKCSNGTSGQGCVECLAGRTRIKVCC
jgi:hypothetical protein